MLSCNDVRDALPAIEAGERADGAVRDHLASCEGCRTESEGLRASLDSLRKDLSAMAPSPFALDAVLEVAHDPAVRARSRRGSWKPVLVTLAAASVLVAVILMTRPGAGTPPEREQESAREDAAFVVMDLLADGRLFLHGTQTLYLMEPDGSFPTPADIARMTAEIRAVVERHAGRDERGVSEATAFINADADTPWQLVQWLMHMCAHPEVRVAKMRFRVLGSRETPFFNDLPMDRGLPGPDGPFDVALPKLKVKLFRYEGETKVKTDAGTWFLGRGEDDAVLAALEDLARRMVEAKPDTRGEIVAPPPRGGGVPYAHVWMITRTLREVGIEQVLFEGAAMPR